MVSQADLRKERAAALDRLLQQVDMLKIEIEQLEPIVVRHRAVVWWNANRGPQSKEFISPLATNDMIDRVTVNYVRHKLSNYDILVRSIVNKPGQISAARRLHARVTGEIAKLYPALQDECARQIRSRETRDTRSIRAWVSDDG